MSNQNESASKYAERLFNAVKREVTQSTLSMVKRGSSKTVESYDGRSYVRLEKSTPYGGGEPRVSWVVKVGGHQRGSVAATQTYDEILKGIRVSILEMVAQYYG